MVYRHGSRSLKSTDQSIDVRAHAHTMNEWGCRRIRCNLTWHLGTSQHGIHNHHTQRSRRKIRQLQHNMEYNCNVLNLLLRFLPNKLIRRKRETVRCLANTWLQGVKRSGLACVVLGRLCRRGGSRHLQASSRSSRGQMS